jgi:hypothetical protein
MARKHMALELSDTRARLDSMLQQLRDEIEQLTGELHQQKSARALSEIGAIRHASTDAAQFYAPGGRVLRRGG